MTTEVPNRIKVFAAVVVTPKGNRLYGIFRNEANLIAWGSDPTNMPQCMGFDIYTQMIREDAIRGMFKENPHLATDMKYPENDTQKLLEKLRDIN